MYRSERVPRHIKNLKDSRKSSFKSGDGKLDKKGPAQPRAQNTMVNLMKHWETFMTVLQCEQCRGRI